MSSCFCFCTKFGLVKGLWYSVFHVSAICNAGFDLFGNSMLYEHSPYVLMVIASMIVCGSLGFIVMMDLLNYKSKKIVLTHLALTTTTFLIFGGMVLFLISDFESVSNNPAIFIMQSLFLSISQNFWVFLFKNTPCSVRPVSFDNHVDDYRCGNTLALQLAV